MDEPLSENEKGVDRTTDQTPGMDQPSKSIEELPLGGKLLVVRFSRYIKLYSTLGMQVYEATVPDVMSMEGVSQAEAERIGLELAEANAPIGWKFLFDERLIVGSISTCIPSVQDVVFYDQISFGVDCLNEADVRINGEDPRRPRKKQWRAS